MKIKYLNFCLVFCMLFGSLLSAYPIYAQDVNDQFPPCTTPTDPDFFFWNDPNDPSIFDWITFGLDGCIAPDTWICDWSFGDGTTATGCFLEDYKQYQSDGDYLVSVAITGVENATLSRTLEVRTHDVAITKFTAPQSARAGQTRQIVVYLRNNRYPENVQVELYKSTSNGYASVGTIFPQLVPVRQANRTTAFYFSYTFTAEDAYNGKVTFMAMAFILDFRDALPGDNQAISLPTRVSR